MSLIGIDVRFQFHQDLCLPLQWPGAGKSERRAHPRRPQPGLWEIEPEEVWQATLKGLRQIARVPAVQRDPPEVMAISASGREIFPVDQRGTVLGPCLMAGDTRGADIEESTVSKARQGRVVCPLWAYPGANGPGESSLVVDTRTLPRQAAGRSVFLDGMILNIPSRWASSHRQKLGWKVADIRLGLKSMVAKTSRTNSTSILLSCLKIQPWGTP